MTLCATSSTGYQNSPMVDACFLALQRTDFANLVEFYRPFNQLHPAIVCVFEGLCLLLLDPSKVAPSGSADASLQAHAKALLTDPTLARRLRRLFTRPLPLRTLSRLASLTAREGFDTQVLQNVAPALQPLMTLLLKVYDAQSTRVVREREKSSPVKSSEVRTLLFHDPSKVPSKKATSSSAFACVTNMESASSMSDTNRQPVQPTATAAGNHKLWAPHRPPHIQGSRTIEAQPHCLKDEICEVVDCCSSTASLPACHTPPASSLPNTSHAIQSTAQTLRLTMSTPVMPPEKRAPDKSGESIPLKPYASNLQHAAHTDPCLLQPTYLQSIPRREKVPCSSLGEPEIRLHHPPSQAQETCSARHRPTSPIRPPTTSSARELTEPLLHPYPTKIQEHFKRLMPLQEQRHHFPVMTNREMVSDFVSTLDSYRGQRDAEDGCIPPKAPVIEWSPRVSPIRSKVQNPTNMPLSNVQTYENSENCVLSPRLLPGLMHTGYEHNHKMAQLLPPPLPPPRSLYINMDGNRERSDSGSRGGITRSSSSSIQKGRHREAPPHLQPNRSNRQSTSELELPCSVERYEAPPPVPQVNSVKSAPLLQARRCLKRVSPHDWAVLKDFHACPSDFLPYVVSFALLLSQSQESYELHAVQEIHLSNPWPGIQELLAFPHTVTRVLLAWEPWSLTKSMIRAMDAAFRSSSKPGANGSTADLLPPPVHEIGSVSLAASAIAEYLFQLYVAHREWNEARKRDGEIYSGSSIRSAYTKAGTSSFDDKDSVTNTASYSYQTSTPQRGREARRKLRSTSSHQHSQSTTFSPAVSRVRCRSNTATSTLHGGNGCNHSTSHTQSSADEGWLGTSQSTVSQSRPVFISMTKRDATNFRIDRGPKSSAVAPLTTRITNTMSGITTAGQNELHCRFSVPHRVKKKERLVGTRADVAWQDPQKDDESRADNSHYSTPSAVWWAPLHPESGAAQVEQEQSSDFTRLRGSQFASYAQNEALGSISHEQSRYNRIPSDEDAPVKEMSTLRHHVSLSAASEDRLENEPQRSTATYLQSLHQADCATDDPRVQHWTSKLDRASNRMEPSSTVSSSTTLRAFLHQHNLERWAPVLEENEVDLASFPLLTIDDYTQMGILVGPRRRLMHLAATMA